MERIVAFDTSLVSENGGDQIILEYCNGILNELFPKDFIVHIPTHDRIGSFGRGYCMEAKYKIMCGTNILASRMPKFKMWDANLSDIKYIEGTCLLGTGWREYEGNPNLYSKYFWKKVLSKDLIHSVRDSYTEEKLRNLGFDNVVNTSCPTMWKLTEEHCNKIETKKSENVITTLTNYRMEPQKDKQMLDVLCDNYNKVYIWIQALEDYTYLKKIYDLKKLILINPNYHCLDDILEQDNIEYCGTRLHAGIRALNKGKRTTIIAKDNRAKEIAKDTNLNVIKMDEMEEVINGEIITDIKLPYENIRLWKEQFK